MGDSVSPTYHPAPPPPPPTPDHAQLKRNYPSLLNGFIQQLDHIHPFHATGFEPLCPRDQYSLHKRVEKWIEGREPFRDKADALSDKWPLLGPNGDRAGSVCLSNSWVSPGKLFLLTIYYFLCALVVLPAWMSV